MVGKVNLYAQTKAPSHEQRFAQAHSSVFTLLWCGRLTTDGATLGANHLSILHPSSCVLCLLYVILNHPGATPPCLPVYTAILLLYKCYSEDAILYKLDFSSV